MNITEMRQKHIDKVYNTLVDKVVDPRLLKQLEHANNAFGKVINSAKAQVEAIALSKNKPSDLRKEIPFLS